GVEGRCGARGTVRGVVDVQVLPACGVCGVGLVYVLVLGLGPIVGWVVVPDLRVVVTVTVLVVGPRRVAVFGVVDGAIAIIVRATGRCEMVRKNMEVVGGAVRVRAGFFPAL